jgi:hypothetical protein
MINIKKLHLVHKYYPNVPRRFGKTTYCYDSLLRASETGTYKNIAYITSKTDFARDSFKDFIKFLDSIGEEYQILDFRTVVLNCSKITFLSEVENKFDIFDGYIEDYFEDGFRPEGSNRVPRDERDWF